MPSHDKLTSHFNPFPFINLELEFRLCLCVSQGKVPRVCDAGAVGVQVEEVVTVVAFLNLDRLRIWQPGLSYDRIAFKRTFVVFCPAGNLSDPSSESQAPLTHSIRVPVEFVPTQ